MKRYRRLRIRRKPRLPYQRRESLLTQGELAFFRVLCSVTSGEYGISIKTRLADIVKCPDELWDTIHGRKLCQKHIDFVLYEPSTLNVVAAIELDDASHEEASRTRRDRFVNAVFKSVGVRLIRVRAASRYDRATIEDAVLCAPKPLT